MASYEFFIDANLVAMDCPVSGQFNEWDEIMPKVLISDKLSSRAATIFEENGIDVHVKPGLSPDELKAIIANYDGLAIRSATKVTVDI